VKGAAQTDGAENRCVDQNIWTYDGVSNMRAKKNALCQPQSFFFNYY